MSRYYQAVIDGRGVDLFEDWNGRRWVALDSLGDDDEPDEPTEIYVEEETHATSRRHDAGSEGTTYQPCYWRQGKRLGLFNNFIGSSR